MSLISSYFSKDLVNGFSFLWRVSPKPGDVWSSQRWTVNWLDEIESGSWMGGGSCLTGCRWTGKPGLIIASPWPRYGHVTLEPLVLLEKAQPPTLHRHCNKYTTQTCKQSSLCIIFYFLNLSTDAALQTNFLPSASVVRPKAVSRYSAFLYMSSNRMLNP